MVEPYLGYQQKNNVGKLYKFDSLRKITVFKKQNENSSLWHREKLE